jgi:hypothetical protein
MVILIYGRIAAFGAEVLLRKGDFVFLFLGQLASILTSDELLKN